MSKILNPDKSDNFYNHKLQENKIMKQDFSEKQETMLFLNKKQDSGNLLINEKKELSATNSKTKAKTQMEEQAEHVVMLEGLL